MTRESRKYKRLPGIKKTFLMSVYRLWLGDDHLLQVHTRVGVETYQRFYFSDIQAMVTRKTIAGKIYNAIFGLIALFLGYTAVSMDGDAAIFFYCAGSLFIVIMGINTLMGPTCRTQLRTAVQQNELLSLHRLRAAQKVMNRVRPLIQAVQGDLSPSQLSQGSVFDRYKPSTPSPKTNRLPPKQSPAVGVTARGNIHMLVAGLLTASAILGLCEFIVNHVALTLIGLGLMLALAIAAIVFLVRQYSAPRHSGMLAAAWSVVGYVVLTVIGGYIVYFQMAFKRPEAMYNQWEQLKMLASVSPWDSTFLTGLQLVLVVFAGILAVVIAVLTKAKSTAEPVALARPTREYPVQTGGRV